MSNRETTEYNVALLKAILEDLRYAMIDTYGTDRVIETARGGGYLLHQAEILEKSGETLVFRLSIEIKK